MADYISRAKAIKAIENLPNCYNGFSDTYDKACIIGVLEELPAVEPPAKCIAKVQFDEDKMRDIVDEVIVHCKDCKHYIYDGDRWLCKVLSNNYEPIVDLDSDGYCSLAEKGEKNDNR